MRRIDGGEALDQLPVDAMELRWRERLRMFEHLVGNTQLLEHAHDLVVQGERARLVVDLCRPIADEDAQPMATQQSGRGRADRAESDDGDVVDVGGHQRPGFAPLIGKRTRSLANRIRRCASFSRPDGGAEIPQWSTRSGGHFHDSGVPTG